VHEQLKRVIQYAINILLQLSVMNAVNKSALISTRTEKQWNVQCTASGVENEWYDRGTRLESGARKNWATHDDDKYIQTLYKRMAAREVIEQAALLVAEDANL